jgi:hypothetical protein
MKVLNIVLLFTLVFFSACKKVDSFHTAEQVWLDQASLWWTGSYATDGCGYILDLNCLEYKFDNEAFIDSSFQVSGEQIVRIEFTKLENEIETNCGDLPVVRFFNGLHIISIERK